MEEVRLYTTQDWIQADIIIEALRRNQIPAYRQGIGSGGLMDIYGGNSIYGEDIFVGSQDVERAVEVLHDMGLPLDEEE
ncbi:MAG: DUF2007 domain-containing protein [Blautia sp.]|jgi:type III secretory pathway lipoprotein EscJ